MRNKSLAIFASFTILFAITSQTVFAQDSETKKKDKAACEMKAENGCCAKAMTCPVTGEAGNKDIFTKYKGQKVYFCCADCKAAFEKDPEKYASKIHKCSDACKAVGCDKEAGKACACMEQTKCPVSGKPVNKDISTELDGRKIYFCCADCKAAFEKDPAKYLANLPKCEGKCKAEGKKECKDTAEKEEKPAQQ
jgi:YHS domain-containing protein